METASKPELQQQQHDDIIEERGLQCPYWVTSQVGNVKFCAKEISWLLDWQIEL